MKTESIDGMLPYGPWKWWMGLIGLACFVLTLTVLQLLPYPLMEMLQIKDQVKGMAEITPLLTAIQFVIWAVCLIIVAFVFARPVSREDFGFYPRKLGTIIATGVGIAVVYIAIVQLIERFNPALAKTTIEGAVQLGFGKGFKKDALIILNVCYLGPFFEEFFFRGFLFRTFRDGLSKHLPKTISLIIALVVSATVFGLAHGGGRLLIQKIELVICGALLALAFVRTGSLTTSILIHGINNSVALLLMLSLAKISLDHVGLLVMVLLAPLIVLFISQMIASKPKALKEKTE